VIERQAEVAAVNAAVMLIAYDRPGLLGTKMMRGLDVPYTILFDPDRASYQQWGLGRTGPFGAWLSPALTWRYLKLLLRGERFLGFAPDMYQLGGDFILDREHRITFAHRMTNNGDRAEVSVLLHELRRASHGPAN
jgi:AhpC/TSA antioxidant enzyme